jgi:uncharacterized protein YjbI with pentapeptide repeats
LYRIQLVVCAVLSDLVPISILLLFWLTYLRCHAGLSFLHAICLAVAVAFAFFAFRLERRLHKGRRTSWLIRTHGQLEIACFTGTLAVLMVITFGALFGTESPDRLETLSAADPRAWVPVLFQHLPGDVAWRADLSERNVSPWLSGASAGKNDTEAPPERSGLRTHNLRGADMHLANLRKANLQDVDLSEANLSGANLEGATFNAGTNLLNANLAAANMVNITCESGCELSSTIRRAHNWVFGRYDPPLEAELRCKGLGEAVARKSLAGFDLKNTNLRSADLRDFDLSGAYLAFSNMADVKLEGANVADTNFTNARHMDPQQILTAKNWPLAYYPESILPLLGLRPEHNKWVQRRNFSGYSFRPPPVPSVRPQNQQPQPAQLRGVDFRGAVFFNADLRYADLSNTTLAGADLTGAHLDNTDFTGSDVTASQVLTGCWNVPPRVAKDVERGSHLPQTKSCN